MSLAIVTAIRPEFQPFSRGLPENPNPGSDGQTTWNASSGLPPWAAGSVSGPITLWNSYTDPGQPWTRTRGKAVFSFERTWMKWIDIPSISVVNWGSSLNFFSWARQSYLSFQ